MSGALYIDHALPDSEQYVKNLKKDSLDQLSKTCYKIIFTTRFKGHDGWCSDSEDNTDVPYDSPVRKVMYCMERPNKKNYMLYGSGYHNCHCRTKFTIRTVTIVPIGNKSVVQKFKEGVFVYTSHFECC